MKSAAKVRSRSEMLLPMGDLRPFCVRRSPSEGKVLLGSTSATASAVLRDARVGGRPGWPGGLGLDGHPSCVCGPEALALGRAGRSLLVDRLLVPAAPREKLSPVLVIVGGLPATGKTTICREVARLTRAVHLRVDTIEQALVDAGLGEHPLGVGGYLVAYAVAREQLIQGQVVLAESVNPLPVTRDAWRAVAAAAGAVALEVEVTCSDAVEHRRRAESREIDVPGLARTSWSAIEGRVYEPWTGQHLVIDTATSTLDEAATCLVSAMLERKTLNGKRARQ